MIDKKVQILSKTVSSKQQGGVSSSVSGGSSSVVYNNIDLLSLDAIAEPSEYNAFSALRALYEQKKEIENRLIKSNDEKEADDSTFYTSLRTLKEINNSINNSIKNLYDIFLRKDQPDKTEHLITFLKGLKIGNYVTGMIGGSGGAIIVDEYGRTKIEVDEIFARERLTVPSITFNNIDVISGEKANTFAYGTFLSVDPKTKTAELELLDGQYGTLKVGDICRGVFHNLKGGNYKQDSLDTNGFLNYSGFATSYFTPTRIITNEPGKMIFQYELQGGTDIHPVKSMNFYAYGNFTDKERQAVTYENRYYKRRIMGVNTWVINPSKHIKMQDGLLDGLSIGGMDMEGVGAYLTNIYMDGVMLQFTPQQLEQLKGESAYSVHLTQDSFTVRLDANDNIIGGLFESKIVTTLGKVTTAKDKIVTVPSYKQSLRIQAHKGANPLFYASEYKEGAFLASIEGMGCTCKVEAGQVILTDVLNKKEAYVLLTVVCEGNASFEFRVPVNFIRDGKDGKDGIGKDGFSEVTLYKASRLSPSVLPSRDRLPMTDSLQETYHDYQNYWSYAMPANLMLSLEFEVGNKQFEQNGFTVIGRDHGKGFERNDTRIKFVTKTKNQKVFVRYTHSKTSGSIYTNSAWLKFNGTTVKSSTVSTSSTLELIAEKIGEQVLTLSFTSAGEKNGDFIQIEFISPDFEELPVWETTTRVIEYNDGKDIYFTHYNAVDKYTKPIVYSNEDARYELQSDVRIIGTNSLGMLVPSAFLVKQMAVKSTGGKSASSYYMTAFYSRDGKEYFVIENYQSARVDRINLNIETVATSSFIAVLLTDEPIINIPETYIDKIVVPVVRDGENVASSSVPVNCGEYDPQRRYYWNKNRRDIVLFTQEGHTDVYMANVFSEDGFIGKIPTDKAHWVLGSKSMFMAIGTLLVDDADFAGFKVKSEKIISQSGRDEKNNPVEYKDVTDFSKFTPNTSIDGRSGQIKTRELIATGFFASPFVEVGSLEDFNRVDSLNWLLTKSFENVNAMFRAERYNGAEISIFNASNEDITIDINLVQWTNGVLQPGIGNNVKIPKGVLFKAKCVKLPNEVLGSGLAWYIMCPHRLVGGTYEIKNYEH